MPRVRLLHWNAAEAASHIKLLHASRYQVDYAEQFRPALMQSWRESPPDAFVINLSRLPSHGREIAIALRQSPKTRFIPLVFCDGPPEKVELIRSLLPDAFYCTLPELALTLQQSLAQPPLAPVKPLQMMDRYQGRTAAQKLGIKPSSAVALLDAPPNPDRILGELPLNVELLSQAASRAAVTLCFLCRPNLVAPTVSRVRRLATTSKLWLLWRKGGSASRGDVTERLVRETALDLGLVDYKICSVDSTWTAMLFAQKK